ncbi:crooked isoform X3 [Nomia melanderi]|uniref:crooked isoform X3 n=1 Tax=Nomia melanderi TaxID=2448451 RepID=UPI003FCE0EE6
MKALNTRVHAHQPRAHPTGTTRVQPGIGESSYESHPAEQLNRRMRISILVSRKRGWKHLRLAGFVPVPRDTGNEGVTRPREEVKWNTRYRGKVNLSRCRWEMHATAINLIDDCKQAHP